MNYSPEAVSSYLCQVKTAVRAGNYRIEQNHKRRKNLALFKDYVIDEAKCREILLSLTSCDFSEILHNEHPGFTHEQLYVFGREVNLLQRFGDKEETVPLYIKLNKLENQFVIIISFHKQSYPLSCVFSKIQPPQCFT